MRFTITALALMTGGVFAQYSSDNLRDNYNSAKTNFADPRSQMSKNEVQYPKVYRHEKLKDEFANPKTYKNEQGLQNSKSFRDGEFRNDWQYPRTHSSERFSQPAAFRQQGLPAKRKRRMKLTFKEKVWKELEKQTEICKANVPEEAEEIDRLVNEVSDSFEEIEGYVDVMGFIATAQPAQELVNICGAAIWTNIEKSDNWQQIKGFAGELWKTLNAPPVAAAAVAVAAAETVSTPQTNANTTTSVIATAPANATVAVTVPGTQTSNSTVAAEAKKVDSKVVKA